MTIRASDELVAVTSRWIDAMNRRDFATAASLFLRDVKFRYVGSDEDEWWSGTAPVDAYERRQSEMPEYHIDVEEIEAFAKDSVGWAAVRTTTRFGKFEPRALRWTIVFVLEGGFWRIAQIHDSFAVPNPEVMGIEMTKSLEDLLAAIGGGAVEQIRRSVRHGTVTLVFTDIEESTRLATSVGDARWSEIVGRHDDTIRSIVEQAGGSVVKTLGDGAMIAFESVRDAARSAVSIQQAFAERSDTPDVRVRIGIHVGDAVSTSGDYLGIAVNKAARVAASARGGQIVVSSAARALLEDDPEFAFANPVTVELKGIDGIHEITELLPAASRPDAE